MKSLIAGVVLILLLGLAGFFYRNVAERTANPPIACTEEAKVCPDGSSVGRGGPSCQFAPCAFPNVEVADAHLAFAVPEGYTADENASGAEPTLVAAFVKPSLSESVRHTITVRVLPIAEGETGDDVILAHTRYQPADMQAEDFEKFDTVVIDGRTLRGTVIERFEGQVQSAYFLVRVDDVVKFEVFERDLTDWMEPTLVVTKLPEHANLLKMLATLQTP